MNILMSKRRPTIRHPLVQGSPCADLYFKVDLTHDEIARVVDDLCARADDVREKIGRRKFDLGIYWIAESIAARMGAEIVLHNHLMRLAALTDAGRQAIRMEYGRPQ